jgi:uncharacterized protein (TIGR00369 family)
MVDGSNELTQLKISEVRDSFGRQGLMTSIGASCKELSHGRCAIELPFSELVGQQQGFFHGGIIGALADVAGGYAAMTLLPAGRDVLTLEYKINFLKPAAGDRLIAEGLVLRMGKSVCVTRADVFAEKNGHRTLCAAMQQSMMAAVAAS